MKIKDIVAGVHSGDLNPTEIVAESLKKIEAAQESNAYISVLEESALAKAKEIEAKRAAGKPLGKLAGVPIAVKDNLVYEHGKTTCASNILEDFKSPYSATVLNLIEKEDGIIIGKTNLDEFAMGSSTENSHFGAVKNPLDSSLIAGGSSGGSAAAVAADTVLVSLGSDTGGSIRQPAACCGVVGLKPTYGRVSRYGLVAFASSLDQVGPFGKSVDDVATLLSVISGVDERDQTSADYPIVDYSLNLDQGIKGKKIGVPSEYYKDLSSDIKEQLEKVLGKLEEQGAECIEVSLPHMEYGVAAYYILATAEASTNLSRFDGVRYTKRSKSVGDLKELFSKSRSEGFGWEVKKRILLGSYVLSAGFYDAYYAQAQKVRRQIKNDFMLAYEKCDVIITPTMPGLPAKLGSFVKDPLSAYLEDIFTVGLNLSGLPGVSVPATQLNGFPLSMQVVGKPFAEAEILQVAKVIEGLS